MTDKKKNFVMEIADLKHDRREVSFAYGKHESITVAYNPGKITLGDIERDPSENRDKMSQQLESWLVEWPLAQDGEPLPITRETLLALPAEFVLRLYQAVSGDIVPAKN